MKQNIYPFSYPLTNANSLVSLLTLDCRHELLELLLKFHNVKIDQYCISRACKKGSIKIIKIMLKDPRVDKYINNCYILKESLRTNHLEITKLLLRDIRIYNGTRFSSLYHIIKFINYFKIDNQIIIKDIMMSIITIITKLCLDF